MDPNSKYKFNIWIAQQTAELWYIPKSKIGHIEHPRQWRIQGGHKGHAPRGPNSFDFMQFLGKFRKIVCWGPLGSWRPLLGKILDPPLLDYTYGLTTSNWSKLTTPEISRVNNNANTSKENPLGDVPEYH